MAKAIGIIAGVALMAVGILLQVFLPGVSLALTAFLITAGAGMILTGIGTLLTKGPAQGTGGASRNPIAPWNVVYGRALVPGTVIYIQETGDENKFIHLVIVVACHPCDGIEAVLVNGEQVFFDTNNNSFTRSQLQYNIVAISRLAGVVTCTVDADLASSGEGARTQILFAPDQSLNGLFSISQTGVRTFTYNCGGFDGDFGGGGLVAIDFANYDHNIHFEYLLGNHIGSFPGLVTVSGGRWTEDHAGYGRTLAYIRLEWDEKLFANGLPVLKFVVRGKNDIMDPRVSPPFIGYSTNPALCIADYLSNKSFGFKASYGNEIPFTDLISAANVCDEAITLASGALEQRYTLNGGFPLTMTRGSILQNLLTSCAGRLSYRCGQFIIAPAAWRGVSMTLGEDADSITTNVALEHAAGNFQFKPKVAGRDRFNGVKGLYVSPINEWQPTDLVPYAQDADHGYSNGPAEYFYDQNLADDLGERRWLDVQLPFTISPTMGQRICKIELLRRRQQGTGTFVFDMFMYQATPFDVIRFTLPALGWDAKLVEVGTVRFAQSKQQNADGSEVTLLGTEIDIQETDPAIYDWLPAEELASAGNQFAVMPDNRNPGKLIYVMSASGITTEGLPIGGTPTGYSWDEWLSQRITIDSGSGTFAFIEDPELTPERPIAAAHVSEFNLTIIIPDTFVPEHPTDDGAWTAAVEVDILYQGIVVMHASYSGSGDHNDTGYFDLDTFGVAFFPPLAAGSAAGSDFTFNILSSSFTGPFIAYIDGVFTTGQVPSLLGATDAIFKRTAPAEDAALTESLNAFATNIGRSPIKQYFVSTVTMRFTRVMFQVFGDGGDSDGSDISLIPIPLGAGQFRTFVLTCNGVTYPAVIVTDTPQVIVLAAPVNATAGHVAFTYTFTEVETEYIAPFRWINKVWIEDNAAD